MFALILQDVLRTQGGYLDGEASVVPAETIDAFCKHVFHLRSLDTSRLLDEFPGPEGRAAGLERLSSVCQEAQWDLFDDEAQVRSFVEGMEFAGWLVCCCYLLCL